MPPIPIYVSTQGPVADPAVAMDSKGTLHVTWWGRGVGEIFYSRSTNRGASWSVSENVSNTPLSSDFPVIAVGPKDEIYLLWEDLSFVPLIGEVVISISKDSGRTWSPLKNISNTRTPSTRPNLTVGPMGEVYAAWIEANQQLFFAYSTDGGVSWSAPKEISQGHPPSPLRSPALTTDRRGTIFAAWSILNQQPFMTSSTDGGITWSSPQPLTGTSPTNQPNLAIAPDGILYAVWSEPAGFATDVVLVQSADGGASFSNPVNVSRSPDVPSMDPQISLDHRGVITCVWHEVISGNTEIFMAQSSDGGKTFSPPINVSRTPGNSLVPRFVLDRKGSIYAIWEQGVKQAIFFSRIM